MQKQSGRESNDGVDIMYSTRTGLLALVLGSALVLGGCNGGGTTASTPPAQPSNLSGDYIGSVQDSVTGTASATATFAQHGSNAGGTLTTTSAGGALAAQVAFAIASSNAISGSMVIDEPNGTTCTFGLTGTYNAAGFVLSGSYTAVTNCSGQHGTYTLAQQCTDTITSADRRAMGLTPC